MCSSDLTADYVQESTMIISETVALTATVDILAAIARVILFFFKQTGTDFLDFRILHIIGFGALVFAGGVLSFLLAAAWDSFRYAGEVVFKKDKVTVIRINRPDEVRS